MELFADHRQSQQPATSERDSAERLASPWKVLLIDDDEQMHQVTKLALSDFDDSLWHYMNGVACGIGVDKEYGKQVRVYPNPTQDRLNIQSQHAGELSIWSVNGSLVHERSISGLPVTVVTTNWPKGCYFVQLETTRQVFRQKVIVY